MNNYPNRVLFKRLLSYARPFWFHLAGMYLLDQMATPLILLTPLPLLIAVDNVLGSRPLPAYLRLLPGSLTHSRFSLLCLAAILQVLVAVLMHLQAMGAGVLRARIGEGLTMAFRAKMFRQVQRLSLLYHDWKGAADCLYRIQYDAPAIRSLTLGGMVTISSAAVMFLVMVYVIARINLTLAVVALAVAPVVTFLSNAYDRRMRGRYVRAKELESHALQVVHEVLGAIRLVKAFGREDSEEQRFVRRSEETVEANVGLAFAEGGIILAVSFATAIGTALVIFLGIRGVQSGALSLGQLLVVLAYLSQLYRPLVRVSSQFATLQGALAKARRSLELLDEAPEVAEKPQARLLTRALGAIEFRDVSFSYNDGRPALRNVSFVVPPKARVGIAGATGAGKTTITSLLMRFYDPVSGEILLDGIDLRDYKLSDLRNQFALVQQETVLFSASIAENIAYARPEATEAMIVESAKLAGAHDFISRLPQGYRTPVGERGMALSGGERQRIALARAFLKDAPILVLDEPTSAIDGRTEAIILEAMDRLTRDRTTVIVAHRLGMLQECDLLLEVRDGQLASATHDVASELQGQFGSGGGGACSGLLG